jgi:hypothetical protein
MSASQSQAAVDLYNYNEAAGDLRLPGRQARIRLK